LREIAEDRQGSVGSWKLAERQGAIGEDIEFHVW
jgi:hypothetical protein